MGNMNVASILRHVAILGGLVALAGAPACAATTDDESDPEDETTGDVSQASTSDGTCHIAGEKGQHFTFNGGRFHLCWVHADGPGGVRDNRYTLYDAFGPGERIKLNLARWPDTHCKRTGYGALLDWEVAGVKFTGKPNGIKRC